MQIEEHAKKILVESLMSVDALVERLVRLGVPTPGSRLARDDDATTPFDLSHAFTHSLRGATDHLLSLRDLLTALRANSPFTLLRSAIENAAEALWLVAPDDRRERITRRLRIANADAKDQAEVMARIRGESLADAWLAEKKARLAALAATAGLPTGEPLGAPASWRSIVNAADECLVASGRTRNVDARLVWNAGSGFAHARLWATLELLERGAQVDLARPDAVRVELSSSYNALALFSDVTVCVCDLALSRAERLSRVWSGTGPDVEH